VAKERIATKQSNLHLCHSKDCEDVWIHRARGRDYGRHVPGGSQAQASAPGRDRRRPSVRPGRVHRGIFGYSLRPLLPLRGSHPTSLAIDRAAINRLQFIAQVAPSLAIQALTIASRHVKSGRDISLYQAILTQLATATSQDIELDRAWIDKTTAQNATDKDKLETELKMYTGNMIKESVRVSSPIILCQKNKANALTPSRWATTSLAISIVRQAILQLR
jgi:hypothetical protein